MNVSIVNSRPARGASLYRHDGVAVAVAVVDAAVDVVDVVDVVDDVDVVVVVVVVAAAAAAFCFPFLELHVEYQVRRWVADGGSAFRDRCLFPWSCFYPNVESRCESASRWACWAGRSPGRSCSRQSGASVPGSERRNWTHEKTTGNQPMPNSSVWYLGFGKGKQHPLGTRSLNIAVIDDDHKIILASTESDDGRVRYASH